MFRYLEGNPNGSLHDIAGVCNERGNVVGLMPHPEHNVEPLTWPSLDGRPFFASVLDFLAAQGLTRCADRHLRTCETQRHASEVAVRTHAGLMRPDRDAGGPTRRAG